MPFLESLLQDIGYALRLLRKSPVFTAAVTLSLALGIGANTAIFSLIDAVMWRTLPVKDPESLVLLTHSRGTAFGAASHISNTGSCANSRAVGSRSSRPGRRCA
jgi:hypothetical protein